MPALPNWRSGRAYFILFIVAALCSFERDELLHCVKLVLKLPDFMA
jgi:hypothetical protein